MLEGDTTEVKAKTAGFAMVEFSSILNLIKPDLVVVRGDRFEVLAAAAASAYMNIPIAHIEGGDISGTLDESVRHAITKLAHFHFATNEDAYNRILRMGENPKYVFNFGSPDVEIVKKLVKKNNLNNLDLNMFGSGSKINLKDGYLMVMYHPVNSEISNLKENTNKLIKAVHNSNMQTIWFWPNFDAGAEIISHELRKFNDKSRGHKIKFLKYLPPKQFLTLLSNSKMFLGNSSAGIKECSHLGIPVINIGSRQNKRLKAENVFNCNHDAEKILKMIKEQFGKKYESSDLYISNDTSREIAKKLASVDVYCQKYFFE
jgi:UDP-hydrolysing UDP-N-acetyl-D-glucosamine 2-epimerase